MRSFDALDTHAFRAFWMASETLNFTEAGKRASMTQSGISQHVQRLEDQLGVPLFLRINKRVLLTEAGKRLRSYIESYLDDAQEFITSVNAEHSAITGIVSYAMPESCLMSPHFGMLLKKRRAQFPDLGLRVSICPSEEVIEKLIRNAIDFGFVTKRFEMSGLKLTPYCQEEYILVSSDPRLLSPLTASDLRSLPFIGYPGVEVTFAQWLEVHFPKSRLAWNELQVAGEMGSLKGVIEMVEHGMGVTVLPSHCVLDQIAQGTLVTLSSKVSASNQIYIATLDGPHLPRRVQKTIETFYTLLQEK